MDNDFAKIARTVRKRWDAVKKLAASTAATVTAPARQNQESGGSENAEQQQQQHGDAQFIGNDDEYEEADAVEAQPGEQQDEIDRLFGSKCSPQMFGYPCRGFFSTVGVLLHKTAPGDNVEKEIAMQTFDSDVIIKTTTDQV